MTTLDNVNARIDAINQQLRQLNDQVASERRSNLTASESRQYTRLAAERAQLEARAAELTDEQDRRGLQGRATELLGGTGAVGLDGVPGSFSRGSDSVYGRGSGNSYFRDLISSAMPGSQEGYDAQQRLNAHAQVIDRAAADLPQAFRAGPNKRAASETRTNPNRTDGQGGYFVPPLWLIDEWIAYLRAGRATADRCHKVDLPPGTDSINIPKIATGSTVATQLDNGTISSTDITDSFCTGPVRTIAGQQDVALQLIEQSPAAFDEIVYSDLISAYSQQLNLQVLLGTGLTGQLKGITQVAGINSVTYTDASPSVPEMYPSFGMASSQVARQRFATADSIVMTPQRWAWITSALDTQGRPLVLPNGSPSMNIVATQDATAAEGVVGSLQGLPVVADPSLPSNLGAGTNQDEVIVGRFQDAWLFEGAMRTRALIEVLSGTLQVRLQAYNYVAFIPDRFPAAFTVLGGTGFISPSGY